VTGGHVHLSPDSDQLRGFWTVAERHTCHTRANTQPDHETTCSVMCQCRCQRPSCRAGRVSLHCGSNLLQTNGLSRSGGGRNGWDPPTIGAPDQPGNCAPICTVITCFCGLWRHASPSQWGCVWQAPLQVNVCAWARGARARALWVGWQASVCKRKAAQEALPSGMAWQDMALHDLRHRFPAYGRPGCCACVVLRKRTRGAVRCGAVRCGAVRCACCCAHCPVAKQSLGTWQRRYVIAWRE
jgi:hypothetical protein